MLRLVMATHSRKTGNFLAQAIRDNGGSVSDRGTAVVSYGIRLGATNVPALNAEAGMADKLEQMQRLGSSGLLVPRTYVGSSVPVTARYPLLARKRQHKSGKDIMAVFQPQEIPWRVSAGAEFFVEYVPIKAEYRPWVFRDRHLGTYKKSMARPEEYKRIGWNYKNGFSFNLMPSDSVPRGAVELAVDSIKSLGLDFGAVDILEGLDDNFYVLEVNTAPGAESPNRQVVQGLARNIVRWEENNYPRYPRRA